MGTTTRIACACVTWAGENGGDILSIWDDEGHWRLPSITLNDVLASGEPGVSIGNPKRAFAKKVSGILGFKISSEIVFRCSLKKGHQKRKPNDQHHPVRKELQLYKIAAPPEDFVNRSRHSYDPGKMDFLPPSTIARMHNYLHSDQELLFAAGVIDRLFNDD